MPLSHENGSHEDEGVGVRVGVGVGESEDDPYCPRLSAPTAAASGLGGGTAHSNQDGAGASPMCCGHMYQRTMKGSSTNAATRDKNIAKRAPCDGSWAPREPTFASLLRRLRWLP